MKKSKILAVCLIGVLMAVGLVLAGCGPNCSEKGECSASVTTLSGSYGVSGYTYNPDVRPCDNDSSCAVRKAISKTDVTADSPKVKCDC
jgi:hypothetical protein